MVSEKLIGEYFDNDKLDLENIFYDYQNYIITIIRNFGLLCAEDEEEIISDVLLVIWKNADRLNKDLKFSPYIAEITRRIIFKKFKQIYNEVDIEDYDKVLVSRFDIDKIIEEKDASHWIIENVKKIGDKEYQVFTKFYFEDKDIKTIAKEMNLSSSNVKIILHRTRQKVKKIKNVFAIVLCAISFLGIVFAKEISIKIYENFWQTGNGIGHAMEEGYIDEPDMEPQNSQSTMVAEDVGKKIEDLDTAVKVDEIVMDDFNLSLTFNVTLSDKALEVVKAEDIWEMSFTDITITDENDYILFAGSDKIKDIDSNDDKFVNTGVNSFLNKRSGNTLKVIYNLYTEGNHFPKSKKLNIEFSKINISKDDAVNTMFGDGEITFTGNWKFSVDVPEKMYNRETYIYKQKSTTDKNYKVDNAVVYETGTDIQVNVENIGELPKHPTIPEYEFFKTLPEDSEFKGVDAGISAYLIELICATDEYEEYIKANEKAHEIEVYLLNSNDEKFEMTQGPRPNGSKHIEDGVLIYNAMFDLTKYDMTDEIRVVINRDGKENIVVLGKEV